MLVVVDAANEKLLKTNELVVEGDEPMKKLMIAAAALAFAIAPAYADDDPSADEVAKIKEAVAAWGCEGGTYEKETEANGVFEAEDVKCKAGQYDFRLDKDFNVIVITAD